jgi:hypothetical protein
MRRLAGLAAFASFAALLSVAGPSAAPAGPSPAGKSIVWQTDFNKALAEAKKQQKLVMIDFYTEN